MKIHTSEVQENIGKMDFKVQYEEGYNLVFQGRNEEGLEKLLPLEERSFRLVEFIVHDRFSL